VNVKKIPQHSRKVGNIDIPLNFFFLITLNLIYICALDLFFYLKNDKIVPMYEFYPDLQT
jgi:hypothetical protein